MKEQFFILKHVSDQVCECHTHTYDFQRFLEEVENRITEYSLKENLCTLFSRGRITFFVFCEDKDKPKESFYNRFYFKKPDVIYKKPLQTIKRWQKGS